MITLRSVAVLGVVTGAVAVGAAYAVFDRIVETRTGVEARLLYPGLAAAATSVREIEVIRAEDNPNGTVTLSWTGDGWIVEERDGYPARTDVVRKLLFDLGELEVIEEKTADPGRFARLDLTDVAQAGSRSTRLVLTSNDGETLVDLHVGKRRESLSGGDPMVYVRPTDSEQSYLAEGDLEMRRSAPEWLFREVVHVPQADIRRAYLTAPSGETLELERITEDGRDFAIVGKPEDRKVTLNYSVNNAATVLDKLLFDDVRKAEGLAFDPSLGHARFVTKDGLTYQVDAAPGGIGPDGEPFDWYRVRIEVPDDASDEAKAAAEATRARTEGWAYRLSTYDVERLRETLATLTEPVEGS